MRLLALCAFPLVTALVVLARFRGASAVALLASWPRDLALVVPPCPPRRSAGGWPSIRSGSCADQTSVLFLVTVISAGHVY
jgi:hypothetical protein